MIKLVIFDWGDVCGLYNLEVFTTFLKKLDYNATLVDAHFKEFKSQFDRGSMTEEQFWTKLAESLNFKHHWSILANNNKKNLVVNWPLLDYITECRKKVRTALLSNMDKTSIDAIKSEVTLEKYFEKIYFSHNFKTGKLDKLVIDKLLDDFKVKPEECIFIDDFPGNITKAQKLGMKTILFVGINDLKTKLQQSIERLIKL